MKYFFIYLAISQLIIFEIPAQLYSKDKIKWYRGEVKQSEGELLKGELALHLEYDAIQIKVSSDSDKLYAFTAAKLDYFSFYDEVLQKERIFYSLPYVNEETDQYGTGLLFFELIKDVDEFALLSRAHFKKVQEGSRFSGSGPTTISTPDGPMTIPGNPAFSPENESKIEYQSLFFITKEGNILPYGIVKGYENNLSFGTITYKSRTYLDKDALKKVLGNSYVSCMEFAKKENLNLKKVKDILQVMNYYDSLN